MATHMKTRIPKAPPDDPVAVWIEQHQPANMEDWQWVRYLCAVGSGLIQSVADKSGMDVQDIISCDEVNHRIQ